MIYRTVYKIPKPKVVELETLCRHLDPHKEPSKHFGVVSIGPDEIVTEKYAVRQYYCNLTGKLCVGSVQEIHMTQKLLDPDVVLRCPSLKKYQK